MPLKVGQVIHDRYRIEILLGRGGMGAVYGAIKYPYRADDGRERTRGRKQRIIRGGAWSAPNPGFLRCAARVAADPRHRFETVGFRLARTVEP